jgi:hypothetical protein
MWTFSRPGARLTIRQQSTSDGLLLVVTDNGIKRTYFFNDVGPLSTFQAEIAASLMRNGWSFVALSSEWRQAS